MRTVTATVAEEATPAPLPKPSRPERPSVSLRPRHSATDPSAADPDSASRSCQSVPCTELSACSEKAKPAGPAAQSPEELERVLELVQEGKLSAADAEKIIRALR